MLDATIADPVRQEVKTAQAASKTPLVFLSAAAPVTVTAYAQSLGVKYTTCQDAADLAAKVAEAIADELIAGYRRHHMQPADLGRFGDILGRLVQIGGAVQVSHDRTIHGDLVLGDKMKRQINAGGGAYVEGDISLGG